MLDTSHPDARWIVFDTETTGIFQFKDKVTGQPIPADAPGQPRLASIAMIVCDDAGRPLDAAKHYIKPDGWSMPQGPGSAGEVNGLTDDYLHANGVPVADVLSIWHQAIAVDGLSTAAFNAQFDAKMMRAELRRAGRDDLFEQTRQFCLMRGLWPYKDRGLMIMRGFVKLAVACDFFQITNENAHDAMADAEAARAILERMIADGVDTTPKVHYAKGGKA